ncbi:TetR/AcrR family transcriptional regulator [Arthrobacter psychrochitiniphilus]|uniref:TetR/AcrR family transcriptional regulator n=1 Tax=Arthrobacter psychrochitiniphilus TaxID=291045 RepID=A0A2V3DV86_9MICC|nr:TetR/AcrR family transcriptional regulator [Arthrobacter psychrochitiniphilus]NYG18636.1 AcrR family transcriptional regulator [Arthrobacter psychrochitiniphilus]PXA66419.1 TetR/AcrR family transcriptional regulator [Arthrobacter psychrochitiniphilus]
MTTNPVVKSAKRGPYAKSKQRKESIVKAAHEVFAAHGYRGGSLQDVADKVGMSQTSLLHYFPAKSDLLLAVLDWRDRISGSGSGQGSVSVPGSGSTEGLGEAREPEEALVDAVIRQASFNETIPGVIELYTVLCAESLTENHPGLGYFTERYERLRGGYARKFSVLAGQGRLRDGVDPARAAANLIALWDGIQTQWLMAPESIDMAACLRDYLQLVVLPEG